jgi:simple sugar transport system substrate-binding protein
MKTRFVLIAVVLLSLILGLSMLTVAKEYVPGDPLKVGFIYVGPIGDLGWTYAHDEARRICEETFPWLTTVYVESVSEGDEGLYIDKLIQDEGCDVVFTTSFGFMDGTLDAAIPT